MKIQAEMDMLMTYIFSITLILLSAAIIYLIFIVPATNIPFFCSFSNGAYCQDLLVASNPNSTKIAVLITNQQSYPILNPSLSVNATALGNIPVQCNPSFVFPGGAIICYFSSIKKLAQLNQQISGRLTLSEIPCPSGDASLCASSQPQKYVANFGTKVSPLSANAIEISLFASTAKGIANGPADPLTATVNCLWFPTLCGYR